jgi:DNA-binding MarR family transcriptional regulator
MSWPYASDVAARKRGSATGPKWLTSDEAQTWRALHDVISGLPTVLSDQLRSDADLSFLEYYVLAGLSEQPDRTLRMSQLALLANSELSRLSHLVGRLEKRGLVRRERDRSDGRFTCAILTPAGHRLAIDVAPSHIEHVRHVIFDVLTETEQHALRGALIKVRSELIQQLLARSPGLAISLDT